MSASKNQFKHRLGVIRDLFFYSSLRAKDLTLLISKVETSMLRKASGSLFALRSGHIYIMPKEKTSPPHAFKQPILGRGLASEEVKSDGIWQGSISSQHWAMIRCNSFHLNYPAYCWCPPIGSSAGVVTACNTQSKYRGPIPAELSCSKEGAPKVKR